MERPLVRETAPTATEWKNSDLCRPTRTGPSSIPAEKENDAATFFLLFRFRKKKHFLPKKKILVVPAESEMSKQLFFFFLLFSLFLFFLFFLFMTKEQLHEKSQVGYSDPFIVPTFFSPDRLCSIRFDPLRWKKQKICSFHFSHQRSLQRRRRRGRVFLCGTRRENSAKLRNLKSKSLNDVDFDFDFDFDFD